MANFQILDDMFSNIIGSGVRILEEVLCDPATIEWLVFEASVDDLKPPEHYRGRAVLLWRGGVSVDEAVHGVVRLLTPAIRDIRRSLSFRCKVVL